MNSKPINVLTKNEPSQEVVIKLINLWNLLPQNATKITMSITFKKQKIGYRKMSNGVKNKTYLSRGCFVSTTKKILSCTTEVAEIFLD